MLVDFEEFFSSLDETAYRQFVADYERFIQNGALGDCFLREMANQIDPSPANILTAISLAQAAHRYFALKYLE